MPQREYEHGIIELQITVQGDISSLSTRNDQLTQLARQRPANQGMAFQDNRILNESDCLRSETGVFCCYELEDPFEVRKRLFGVNYLRQGLAFGRGTFLPCTRLPKYA